MVLRSEMLPTLNTYKVLMIQLIVIERYSLPNCSLYRCITLYIYLKG